MALAGVYLPKEKMMRRGAKMQLPQPFSAAATKKGFWSL